METREEILLPFCHLFRLLTSDRYNLHTNPYNYATTNLTRQFGIPLERAGLDLYGIWSMMMMTMILRAHTLNSGTWPHSLETSIRETPSPSFQILRTFDSETRKTSSTRFSQYQVVRAREPASFWRENAIADVILLLVLHVLARMS